MKYKIKKFNFLHFILIIYSYFFSFFQLPVYSYDLSQCPNLSFLNYTEKFPSNQSSSIPIIIKEQIFSSEKSILSKYKYFIITSKKGNISVYNFDSNGTQSKFSIDFKKKMYETNIVQINIIHEEKVILAMEGKLFFVKKDFDMEYFEEFMTPISEYVDMVPFSLWFMPDYYFMGSKKYSIIKVNKRFINVTNDELFDTIIFVDFTLICLKDNEQVWNTTITNVYFSNNDNNMGDINLIEEIKLIYETKESLEDNIDKIMGEDYSDIISIHGYDEQQNKYIKIYDFNTYNHVIETNSNNSNNMTEKTPKDFMKNKYYSDNEKESYEKINHKLYSRIVIFIIIWILILVFHNFIYKIFHSIYNFTIGYILNKQKLTQPTEKKLTENNRTINKAQKMLYAETFKNIKNYFLPETKDNSYMGTKRKNTIDKYILQTKIEKPPNNEIKAGEINLPNFQKNTPIKFKKSNSIDSKKDISNSTSRESDLNIINIKKRKESSCKFDNSNQTRLERDFKDIHVVRKKCEDIILKAKHKLDDELYCIKIKKLSNQNDEQAAIIEAKSMTKIHTKHIVEYITCWFDNSLGSLKYLFDKDDKILKCNFSDGTISGNDFPSSKDNIKIIFNKQNYNLFKKNNKFVKQLYDNESHSDDELWLSQNKRISIEKRFYQKNTIKNKNHTSYDSLIDNKIQRNNISNQNMYFFIQMEYCDGLTLSDYIIKHSQTGIDNKTMYTFTYQLIKSLAKIHENKIIHKAINPENIFIINETSIKIGDFSSAREVESQNKKKKNFTNLTSEKNKLNKAKNSNDINYNTCFRESWRTYLYQSPEQKAHNEVNKKCDIYMAGLVLYEMCECFLDEKEAIQNITNLKKNKVISDKVKKKYGIQYSLILKMLENNPDNRPDCEKILNSEEMKKWKNKNA